MSVETRGTRSARFRPDVEGLRAVAVVLVLAYHAGVPWLHGGFVGVDVFFVISGFLITGVLLGEAERTGRVSLPAFFARRARRLLPAATLALVACAALVATLAPVTSRRAFGGDVVASALAVVNWRLAAREVDYLADTTTPSPVLHYWSLGVEEQFYLVWAVAVVVAVALARRRGWAPRRLVAAAAVGVGVPSLVWSVVATAAEPATAFFVTTTRLWEPAIGAGLAVVVPWFGRLPRAVAIGLQGAGLAAVVGSAVLLRTESPWPGALALGPTLGTAALLAAGPVAGRTFVARLLGSRPAVWVGGLSYSLYLWHWPPLAAAAWVLNPDDQAGPTATALRVALVVAAVVPAWASRRFVEDPLRWSPALRPPLRALAMGAACVAVSVALGLSALRTVPPAPPTAAETGVAPLGAEVVRLDPAGAFDLWQVDVAESITPAAVAADRDVPDAYARGCQATRAATTATTCEYGDRDGAVTVALVGDSKALQWVSVLDAIATERGWRLVTVTKSSCPYADAMVVRRDGSPYTQCARWFDDAAKLLERLDPDAVVTSQTAARALVDPDDPEAGYTREAMVSGLAAAWSELVDAGIPVVALLDNPTPEASAIECVARHPRQLSTCSFPLVEDDSSTTQREALVRVPAAAVVDLRDVFCPGGRCPAVMGDVLVYRYGSHVTRTFVDSTRNQLEPRLVSALDEASPRTTW